MSVLYIRKSNLYEHHAFLLAGFGSQRPSTATQFITFIRCPWRLSSASPTLKRNFPPGKPTAQLVNRGGRTDWGWEDWIYINGKMTLNSFASCNLASTSFSPPV